MPDVNWPLLAAALSVLNTVGIAIVSLVMWTRKPGEEAGARIAELAERLNQSITSIADRVSRLEEQSKHYPTNADVARVAGELREVNARVHGIVEGQVRQNNQLDRIETFLLLHQSKEAK